MARPHVSTISLMFETQPAVFVDQDLQATI
jgi:hypothetical protein